MGHQGTILKHWKRILKTCAKGTKLRVYSRINQSCMIIKSNNQSIHHKVTHVGPPPKPDWSCMNWSHKFHYFWIMKIHYSCLCKTKRSRRSFENQSGIKTIWEKIGFLKFIWKMGISRIIGKIGVLEFIWRSDS